MNILDNIYYGDTPPVEQTHLNNPDYNHLITQYNQLQESLLSNLSGEFLQQFKKLESLNLQIQSLIEKECWQEGFKAGVQLMVESLGKRDTTKES